MNINIRPATKSDALHVAALIDIAGHGIETDFWRGNVDADASSISAARRIIIEDESLPYHFSKAHLLEVAGEVAGGLIGCYVKQSGGHLASFPDYFTPLLELETFVQGYWAVIGIAVYSEFRGHGYAAQLLDFAKSQAQIQKAKGLSLVVEDTNMSAIAIYKRYGFEMFEKRDWLPYGGRIGPKNWLLMTMPL